MAEEKEQSSSEDYIAMVEESVEQSGAEEHLVMAEGECNKGCQQSENIAMQDGKFTCFITLIYN